MVGVAKGEDRDAGKEEFYRTGTRPFALRHNDPVLYFVQRMRDKVHRLRALLAHFGSAKTVARANLADLEAVPGVSKGMAQ